MLYFPKQDTKENYLAGFWQWVDLLASNDYQAALEALYWTGSTNWTADGLREAITTFFGGDDPWYVVIPNNRLIGVINANCEFQLPQGDDRRGWFLAHIPLTTKPDDPKDDLIPLMGLAVSFFVHEIDSQYVFEHEIFHA